jgi:lipopolysaccharide/colanic/teichoic acid biosynthesis glycosyltransferase
MSQIIGTPLIRHHAAEDHTMASANRTTASHRLGYETANLWKRAVKRLIDLIGAGLGLLCLLPILIIVAVLIRLESRGPILFLQKRMGRGERVFWCWKFRTMVVDAEARLKDLEHLNESEGGVLFKIKRDPRITRLGGFLRRSSLDELPQLVNVLRGEMSLVGPRPLQIRDCELLEQADPVGYRSRLAVPQGLTGLWQVGGRSDTSFERMVALDIAYARQWSLALDLKILVSTVAVVVTSKGAC